jgi:alpha-galactosidase
MNMLAAILMAALSPETKGPVKVFILAGQSNMQGQGALKTIDWLGKHPTQGGLLDRLRNKDGSWNVRDDVWVYYPRDAKTLKKGPLTAGYGAGDDRFGPEWTFGHVVGDRFENQVLLIKTAWGGRSLAGDFRPPSSGGTTGASYTQMIDIVRDCLKNLQQHFPDYDGSGYELAGFVWFQGWNDLINTGRVTEYESNLVHLIKDVRRDLDAPNLPFVIGQIGVGGEESGRKNPAMASLRKAQSAAAERPEFKGSVACVATSAYWDQEAEDFLKKHWINRKWDSEESKAQFETMGNQPEYHYLGSARIFALIGQGLGEAMLALLPKQECRTVEGWTVMIRRELLEEKSELGREALPRPRVEAAGGSSSRSSESLRRAPQGADLAGRRRGDRRRRGVSPERALAAGPRLRSPQGQRGRDRRRRGVPALLDSAAERAPPRAGARLPRPRAGLRPRRDPIRVPGGPGEPPLRERPPHRRREEAALRADERAGVLRGGLRGLVRVERFLSLRAGGASGSGPDGLPGSGRGVGPLRRRVTGRLGRDQHSGGAS